MENTNSCKREVEMEAVTKEITTEDIIKVAADRPEMPWKWGIFLPKRDSEKEAASLGVTLDWDAPIKPGDYYLAKRNTGFKLLRCSGLGEAFVIPDSLDYFYDFSECVKVNMTETKGN